MSFLTSEINSSSFIGGIFIISRFSETCSGDFCPTKGAKTPGAERINCKARSDGFKSLNSGIAPGAKSRPCINGTLVKTPMPNFDAASKIDMGEPLNSWVFFNKAWS